MEQHDLWRNLTGTACVLGLAITSLSINSTPVVESLSGPSVANYSVIDKQAYNSSTNFINTEINNNYVECKDSRLEAEAENLFGRMRVATAEESESVNNYVKSISKNTGVNFFDLC